MFITLSVCVYQLVRPSAWYLSLSLLLAWACMTCIVSDDKGAAKKKKRLRRDVEP